MTEIQQYVYGRDRRGGWGVIYWTEEVERARSFVEILNGKIGLAPDAAQDAVKLKYFFIESHQRKRWILAHSLPGGLDSGGRPGAWFSHCLVGESLQNEVDCLPVQAWDWSGWVHGANQSAEPRHLTVPFRPDSLPQLKDFLEPLEKAKRVDLRWIAHMLDKFLLYEGSGRRDQGLLFITGQSSTRVISWVGVLSSCLPEKLAREVLTFSTYEDDRADDLWFCAGSAAAGAGREQIDPGKKCDRSEAAGPWGRFCVQCLRGEGNLNPEVLELAKMFYGVVDRGAVRDSLNECANLACWVYGNSPCIGKKMYELPPVLKVISKGRQSDQVRLLVALQRVIWPARQTARSDGVGLFERSSAGWIQVAQKLVNRSGDSIQRLRGSYLELLRHYWSGPEYIDFVQHLDDRLLTPEEKRQIFDVLGKLLPLADINPFCGAIETCLKLGFEQETIKILLGPDCRENIRDLSAARGYSVNVNVLPESIQAALGRALQDPGGESSVVMESENKEIDGASIWEPFPEDIPRVEFPERRAAERRTGHGVDEEAIHPSHFEKLAPEELQDPRFISRLARARKVTVNSNSNKKSLVRQDLWRFAKLKASKVDPRTPESLFDIYYWTLWQAQQGRDLITGQGAEEILKEILGRVSRHGKAGKLLLRMLREVFEHPTRRRQPVESWLGKLFELSFVERLTYRWPIF